MRAVNSGHTTCESEVPLIPSRIHKVLSTMAAHQVQALLMGGQACVFYGAAEFSRDTDLLILANTENLQRLQTALHELRAEHIAVPPFQAEYLHRGHAIHFRCQHPDAVGMRVDVMSVLRGVDTFPKLWARRTTLTDTDGTRYELLALPDLVQAKKTQRDKDWLMLRRLLEAHYFQHRQAAEPAHVRFWLRELRTPELLLDLAAEHPGMRQETVTERPLLSGTASGDISALARALAEEEQLERDRDRLYWLPLKVELERLRHEK